VRSVGKTRECGVSAGLRVRCVGGASNAERRRMREGGAAAKRRVRSMGEASSAVRRRGIECGVVGERRGRSVGKHRERCVGKRERERRPMSMPEGGGCRRPRKGLRSRAGIVACWGGPGRRQGATAHEPRRAICLIRASESADASGADAGQGAAERAMCSGRLRLHAESHGPGRGDLRRAAERPWAVRGRIVERVRGRTKKRRIPGVKAAGDTIQRTNRRHGNACD
jgi:hypothetical protein